MNRSPEPVAGTGRVADGTRVAFTTSGPPLPDDPLHPALDRVAGLAVEYLAWDDPAVEWSAFDWVVIRSAPAFPERLDEFLEWCDRVGPDRLGNPPGLVRWNSDRRYLAELDGSGLPVPPTLLVAPLGLVPDLHGEVVVKPVVGGGTGETGRFRPEDRAGMLELLERLGRHGAVAMLQPYLQETEEVGGSELTFFGGEFVYAVKRPAAPGPRALAETAGTPPENAADAGPPPSGEAHPAEIELGRRVAEWITGKFGRVPLHLRIDTLLTGQGPVVMEVNAIEADLSFGHDTERERPGVDVFAEALLRDPGPPTAH